MASEQQQTDSKRVEQFWSRVIALVTQDGAVPLNELEGLYYRTIGNWKLFVNGHKTELPAPGRNGGLKVEPFGVALVWGDLPVVNGNPNGLHVMEHFGGDDVDALEDFMNAAEREVVYGNS